LDSAILEGSTFLQVGSLSLTTEPARTAALEAINRVKHAGGLVSYDPNWREALWRGTDAGIAAMKSLLPVADVLKVSDTELFLLSGQAPSSDYRRLTTDFLAQGIALVLVTLGSEGVYYRTAAFDGIVPCRRVQVVDTTGAGDSFTGAVLFCLTRNQDPLGFSEEALRGYLVFANAAASLCVTRRGAIPALPDREEVERFLR
jgi:fructokinase